MKEWIAKKKLEWEEMGKGYKWAIISIIAATPFLLYIQNGKHEKIVAEQEAQKKLVQEANAQRAAAAQSGGQGDTGDQFSHRVLPRNNRNQGLEDMSAKLDAVVNKSDKTASAIESVQNQIKQMFERQNNLEAKSVATAAGRSTSVGLGQKDPKLSDSLPDVPQAGIQTGQVNPGNVDFGGAPPVEPARVEPATRAKVWDAEPVASTKGKDSSAPVISVPIFSGIESVMLTGINARSNAAGGQAAGSVVSANNVGAPFVTRVKGWAVGPNRTKVSELNDCFIGGSGVGILSTGRANVISSKISCVDKNGLIFEGNIKAYGVDLDGVQGITGRVVTKQGSILAKATVAGIASGLGTALAPSGIQGYNSNQTSGQQGIQYANPSLVAQQAVGGGISSATQQLSKFYLDYAKEMFPVIEVDAGSRVTWILQETLDLVPKTK